MLVQQSHKRKNSCLRKRLTSNITWLNLVYYLNICLVSIRGNKLLFTSEIDIWMQPKAEGNSTHSILLLNPIPINSLRPVSISTLLYLPWRKNTKRWTNSEPDGNIPLFCRTLENSARLRKTMGYLSFFLSFFLSFLSFLSFLFLLPFLVEYFGHLSPFFSSLFFNTLILHSPCLLSAIQ